MWGNKAEEFLKSLSALQFAVKNIIRVYFLQRMLKEEGNIYSALPINLGKNCYPGQKKKASIYLSIYLLNEIVLLLHFLFS